MSFRCKNLGIIFIAIILFSSAVTIGSATTPDGTYVPISISYDYSAYGDYIGFYEGNDPFLIAYNNNEPSGVSSSDSLLSESWAVEVLIDDDHSPSLCSGSSLIFQDGYASVSYTHLRAHETK
ncbi:hypothetical protein, partial [Methanosarcina sp. 2.H.T.1A.3]|uniref:hypothetical protein n=1 Tax=Methanosarcina sp. 2.H.T.1A.3 TaxID=1483597 RepID=UPI00064EDB2E